MRFPVARRASWTPCSPTNDAYDTMAGYCTSGDARLVFDAAATLGVHWSDSVAHAVRATIADVESQIEADAVQGRLAASGEPEDVADRFATALAVCDALLGVVAEDAGADARARATAVLPILLYVNELREQCSIPRICLTDRQISGLLDARAGSGDDGTLAATAAYIAPLARDEWAKHRDDVLWDPGEAKRRAKEEDEKRNKEALAAKFAHIKDDPGKEAVEL